MDLNLIEAEEKVINVKCSRCCVEIICFTSEYKFSRNSFLNMNHNDKVPIQRGAVTGGSLDVVSFCSEMVFAIIDADRVTIGGNGAIRSRAS